MCETLYGVLIGLSAILAALSIGYLAATYICKQLGIGGGE